MGHFRRRRDDDLQEVFGDTDPSLPLSDQVEQLTQMILVQLSRVARGGLQVTYEPYDEDERALFAGALITRLIENHVNVELRVAWNEPLLISAWKRH